MRFTAEQSIEIQKKMIEAHEAKLAAYMNRDIAERTEFLEDLKRGCERMIETWQGLWPDLMQLVPPAETIANDDELAEEVLESAYCPLILEYTGVFLKVVDVGDQRVRVHYLGSSDTCLFDKRAEISQEIWAYFGKRLTEQVDSLNDEFDFEDKVEPVMDAVWWELKSAYAKHGDINSLHEGYAVIDEERAELWDEVRKTQNSKVLSPEAVKELVQIAAMAIRTLIDLKAEIA